MTEIRADYRRGVDRRDEPSEPSRVTSTSRPPEPSLDHVPSPAASYASNTSVPMTSSTPSTVDLQGLPEAVIDHQVRALRARLGGPNEAPSDRNELAALEGELLRRASPKQAPAANLPAAPNAFRGISMMGTVSPKPLPSAGAPIKVGNYQLRPHEEKMADGSKAVSYFIAYNTQTKQNDYVVGPGAVKSFEQAHAQLENLAAVYHQSGWRPYEAKSAAVVEHMMKEGFSGALAKLYEANKAAAKDPAFWTSLVTNVATGIATAPSPKGRPAVPGERPPTAPRQGASPEPVRARRYTPTESPDPSLPAGDGATDKYGNVTYSPHGTAKEVALARAHESVHSALAPKQMNRLREFRADVGMAGYQRSALCQFLEEALAESYAQVKVNGVKALPDGIKFPITNGYVTLHAVASEVARGVEIGTVVHAGIVYVAYLVADALDPQQKDPKK